MVRGGLFTLVLVLLLVPSVSAALSMTCPASAQATHPFTISASDQNAATIKLRYLNQWHEYTGTSASASVTEPTVNENTTQTYDAESYDSSGNLLDSAFCNVYIDSANFPGSVSASPSSLSLVVGQSGSVLVSASDEDGISHVKLGGFSYTCAGFGGYPPSCSHTFTVSYTRGETYQLTPSVQDKWGNTVTGAPVTRAEAARRTPTTSVIPIEAARRTPTTSVIPTEPEPRSHLPSSPVPTPR